MIVWWKGLWYALKRKLARYHPQTKEQIIDGNRRYWDDNYRMWRNEIRGGSSTGRTAGALPEDGGSTPRPLHHDSRMTLFPDGQQPPEIEK